jgi:hypothetical protein
MAHSSGGHRNKHKLGEKFGWECAFCTHLTSCGACDPSSPKHLHATIDHIDPISTGGSRHSQQNWQLLCYACNQVKGNYPINTYDELCELVYAIQVEGHPNSLALLRTEKRPGRAHVYRCRYSWCQQWHILMTSQVA